LLTSDELQRFGIDSLLRQSTSTTTAIFVVEDDAQNGPTMSTRTARSPG
jgi:hypothetical protein